MASLLEKHKWSRFVIFLMVLPGLFTYTSLTNWLWVNECWSMLKHKHSDGPISDILQCKYRGIPLPAEGYPSIVLLSQSIMDDHGPDRNVAPQDMDRVWLFTSQNQEENSDSTGPAASTTVNKYGFRSNKNKRRRSNRFNSVIPFATYLLGAINIGLYWVYWNYRVDPGRIVHNSEIVHDYGRAFTSTFGHFEIWHVGINMMTLFSLGAMLEERVYGSIPFFLYTMSFVPLTAILVVIMQKLRNTQSSMVGFSGILFAWSVVATLSSSQSCPIPFLPDFCFSTFQFFGMSVSLGPLVQLVFLQVVLPRVSFVGHLSGIVVGFLWQWHILPPLEWLQPSISFPILWVIGKLVLPRFPSWDICNTVVSNRGGVSGGYAVGGGSSGVSGSESGIVSLVWIRNILAVHLCLLAYAIGSIWNSTIMSQVLTLLVLSLTINARKNNHSDTNTPYSDWAMMGRGFVIFLCSTIITDVMTTMGWLTLHRTITSLVATCILLRWVLLYSSLSIICHMLHVANQTISGSIWFDACSWMILESCRPLGAWLIAHLPSVSDRVGSGRESSRGYSRLVMPPPESPTKSIEPAQVSNIV